MQDKVRFVRKSPEILKCELDNVLDNVHAELKNVEKWRGGG